MINAYSNSIWTAGALAALITCACHAETPPPPSPAGQGDGTPAAHDETAAKFLEAVRTIAVTARLKDYVAELLSQRSSALDLKRIEPDSPGNKGGWAVDYQWSMADDGRYSKDPEPDKGNNYLIRKRTYRLDIDGSYAFADTNTNTDLSTVNAAVRLERGNLGKVAVNDAALNEAYLSCLQKLPAAPADEAQRRKYDSDMEVCIRIGGIDRLVAKQPGGYYYSLDFHGGLEANQNYSDTHTLFGLTAALASQPSRAASDVNLLDWPFRLLRNRIGQGSGNFVAPFPSLKFKAERIDASSDAHRTLLTTKTTYTRAEGEVAFNTIVANLSGNLLRLTLSYRYFQEFSPPPAIKQAGQDGFDFLNTSLRLPAKLLPFVESDDFELFVSYTSGRLPFDPASDQAVEIGFASNFKVLGKLLSQ